MTDLDALLERAKIAELKARYCRLIDTKDWDRFADLFTDDAEMDVRHDTGLPPINGRAAIVDQVRLVLQQSQSAHQVHSPEIIFDSADNARAIWAMQDRVKWPHGASPIPPVTAITGHGHYHERYARADGTWRIAALKLTRLLVEFSEG